MNKKGFTLMELLLVVAILAIVAAAAAPTFTSGAGDALKEARKSAFLGAYQNAVTGAHMMIAIAAAKAYDPTDAIDLDTNAIMQKAKNDGTLEEDTNYKLEYYSPLSTRQFKLDDAKQYYCGAYVAKDHKLYITVFQANGANKKCIDMYSGKTSSLVLDDVWEELNGRTPSSSSLKATTAVNPQS